MNGEFEEGSGSPFTLTSKDGLHLGTREEYGNHFKEMFATVEELKKQAESQDTRVFTKFPQLPAEIRLMIYLEALAGDKALLLECNGGMVAGTMEFDAC